MTPFIKLSFLRRTVHKYLNLLMIMFCRVIWALGNLRESAPLLLLSGSECLHLLPFVSCMPVDR